MVKPFGFMVSMTFGLVFAYLTIVTGRWLFGRKSCEGAAAGLMNWDAGVVSAFM